MRKGTSVILAVLGAAVLALGLTYGTGPGGRTDQAVQGARVFPDLAGRLGAAAKIDIENGARTLHLARDGKADDAVWVVADRGGYRALQDKVHELLTGLTELRLNEPRTSDHASYARLGVADPGKDSDATLVRVLDDKGGTIASLILGHVRTAQRGDADTVYVRRPGEAQSWLADGKLAATSDPQDWMDRTILNIDPQQVAQATITRGDATVAFARKDGSFTLTAPADHGKLDPAKIDDVSRALSDLTLEDVKRAPAPGTKLGQAAFTTTGGMTVTVDVTKDGPALWATFAATGKNAAPVEDKVKGWAYEIGSWKESALVPTLADVTASAAPPRNAVPPSPMPGAVLEKPAQ